MIDRMIPYLPHSTSEIEAMLKRIGVSSIEDLFSDIPQELRLSRPLKLPDTMAEADVFSTMRQMAEKNRPRLLFVGGGQYDHSIPSIVPHLAARSEFVTAYTPYQPEISQGILQALFEFQSIIAEITGLPVSNASLYDGFTAATEACLMALNSKKKAPVLLIAETLHPYTWSVLRSFFAGLDVHLIKLDQTDGRTELKTLTTVLEKEGKRIAGVLVQTPNFYGALEDLGGWADAIHEIGAKLIISAHPLSPGILASPAEWGADIAIGDTQPMGLPPYFGGPSAGYIACERGMMRRMPGRIVGETVDADGKRAFVLTLQAREQHIKRERATSNICSNQSLAALVNTIYMVALGPGGFQKVSERNTNAASALRDRLTGKLKIKDYTSGPIFNEFTLRIPVSRKKWLTPFDAKGIVPGFFPKDLDSSLPANLFTIAVTEKRTGTEVERYIECAREALG